MGYDVNHIKWIINGVCRKEELGDDSICNLGYACDGCPYNEDVGINRKYPLVKVE